MKKSLISLLFVLTINIFSQNKIAEYSKLQDNFFNSFDKPISIAIFPFYFKHTETVFAEKFYNQLPSEINKQSNFIINFYKKLESLKDLWGFKEWDIKNLELLKKLNEHLAWKC